VEEFHQQLQDATNFPLRPFVIPFLKVSLESSCDYDISSSRFTVIVCDHTKYRDHKVYYATEI